MSDTVADLALGIHLSDPKPGHCASCWGSSGPDVRFVDFNAAIDRGSFRDPNGAMPVIDHVDELHICEACMRAGAEALALKADRNQRQLREIQRLEREVNTWKEYSRKLEEAIDHRPEDR